MGVAFQYYGDILTFCSTVAFDRRRLSYGDGITKKILCLIWSMYLEGVKALFWDTIVGGSCACAYRGLWGTVSVVADFFSIGSSLCRADNTN